jgi:hypothetical protein
MSNFNRSKKYKVNELIVSKKDDTGVSLLVSLDDSDCFYKIDGIASKAWEMLSNNQSIDEVIKNLSSQYPTHKDQLLSDLDAFFQDLVKLGVLIE